MRANVALMSRYVRGDYRFETQVCHIDIHPIIITALLKANSKILTWNAHLGRQLPLMTSVVGGEC